MQPMANYFPPNGEVPVVETERLRLRCNRVEDLEVSLGMWSDLRVMQYLGAKALSREEAWTRLLRRVGHWALLGYGFWAVEEPCTGQYVGAVGFMNAYRDIAPPLGDAPEIGWVLASHAQGKGYATEAVRAAVAWGDERFGAVQTVCLIHPDNRASMRVAEKCGYRELYRTTYKEQPAIVLGRL
jgi:RimJ/RimL family protein N-acetyltransferase